MCVCLSIYGCTIGMSMLHMIYGVVLNPILSKCLLDFPVISFAVAMDCISHIDAIKSVIERLVSAQTRMSAIDLLRFR